jgi:hypothetical protein
LQNRARVAGRRRRRDDIGAQPLGDAFEDCRLLIVCRMGRERRRRFDIVAIDLVIGVRRQRRTERAEKRDDDERDKAAEGGAIALEPQEGAAAWRKRGAGSVDGALLMISRAGR